MINIIIFLSVFIMLISLYFTCYKVNVISFSSKNPGKHVLIVAGTHGNEPAGSFALQRLINYLNKKPNSLKSGKLTIIKNINKCGYFLNSRNYVNLSKKYDINRLYGRGFPINKQVENIVDNADVILDIHEGWGYIQKDNSIGSSITFSNEVNTTTRKLFLKMMNHDINIDHKRFIELKAGIIPYSLRDYAKRRNKIYMLLETTGQNNVQPLELRIKQTILYVMFFIKHYKIIY